MYICPNCNKTSESPMNFCSQCGTPMINQQPAPAPEAQPVVPVAEPVVPVAEPVVPVAEPVAPAPAAESVPAQPTYQPPVYTAPTYVPQPEIKPVHLAKKIVSLALSAAGLFFAVFGILYTLIGLVEEAMAFAMSFVFSMFSVPLSIVGMVMASNNISCGDTSPMSRIGKRLALAGIIVSAVMAFIGFTSLIGLF